MNSHLPANELVIRPASFADIVYIQQIVAATWPVTYTPILGQEQVDYMIDKLYNTPALEEQMRNQHYFFLALKEYSPVGFASFSPLEQGIFKLQKLYVLPSAQKTGAGKALLQKVENEAKSMGAIKLLLNVNRHNIARGFYEKSGFAIMKEEDISIGHNYFMNDYVMQKTL